MSEAFEIGVTLALSDGVSDGIARARQEMAALQHVLAMGGVSVAQLRKTAMEAHPVPQLRSNARDLGATSGATPTPTLPQSQIVLEEASLAPVPQAVTLTETGAYQAALVEEDIRGPRVGDPVQPPSAAAQAPSRVAAMPAEVETLPTPVVHAAIHAPSPRALRDSVVLDVSGKQSAEVRPTLPDLLPQTVAPLPQPDRALLPPANAWASYRVGADQAARSNLESTDSSNVDWVSHLSGQPNSPAPNTADNGRQNNAPAAPRAAEGPGRGGWRDSAVPLSGVVRSASDVLRTGTTGPSASVSTAPSNGTQAPMEGDVYLDGLLVGRWMSRFLAKEAGRASAGPTGFDGRRGRLLPSPTVGN